MSFLDNIPFIRSQPDLSSASYSSFFGTAPQPTPTVGVGQRAMAGAGIAGRAVWNFVGGVGQGVLSAPHLLIEKVLQIGTDVIILGIQGSGNAVAYIANTNNPIISSSIPAATGSAFLWYGSSKLYEGFSDLNWVSIKKSEPKKNLGKQFHQIRFVPDATGKLQIEFDDPAKNNEYRIQIPFTVDDLVIHTDKTSKTATCILLGAGASALGMANVLGAFDRTLGFNFVKSGLLGWTVYSVSEIPNASVYRVGSAVGNTSPGLVSVALSTIFSLGALWTWSTIKVSGKDGLIDLEKKGVWGKIVPKALFKTSWKLALGGGLLLSAAIQVSNVLPGLND